MKKIGITGGSGFIGSHLANWLNLFPDEFLVSKLDKAEWDDMTLDAFVDSNDVIVHLAALNRHGQAEAITETNLSLNQKLIDAFNRVKASGKHLIFSSSTQEENQSVYGRSKKMGRELLVEYAESSGNKFVGMLIPNVFGPFGKPFYNSVIATFSHQLLNGSLPKIEVNGYISFIYVQDLVKIITAAIREKRHEPEFRVQPTFSMYVSELLNKLEYYHRYYIEAGHVPAFEDQNELDLFNTFRSYADIQKMYPKYYKNNIDARGNFIELMRSDGLGQTSYSTTVPGITRGNHFHTRKVERFSVISGKASIQMRKIDTNEVLSFELNGQEPAYVDMPIWYTHNITNIGTEPLLTVFWISEYYDENDPDTYFVNV